eukprot:COSAG06_NODE_1232_length_10153_cov_24.843246_14_plen_81_part_00
MRMVWTGGGDASRGPRGERWWEREREERDVAGRWPLAAGGGGEREREALPPGPLGRRATGPPGRQGSVVGESGWARFTAG